MLKISILVISIAIIFCGLIAFILLIGNEDAYTPTLKILVYIISALAFTNSILRHKSEKSGITILVINIASIFCSLIVANEAISLIGNEDAYTPKLKILYYIFAALVFTNSILQHKSKKKAVES